jgi:hypothetical protein
MAGTYVFFERCASCLRFLNLSISLLLVRTLLLLFCPFIGFMHASSLLFSPIVCFLRAFSLLFCPFIGFLRASSLLFSPLIYFSKQLLETREIRFPP